MSNNRILASELYNTGGGCMVYFADLVIDDFDIHIGIDENGMVGYSKRFQDIDGDQTDYVIWSTDDWNEMIEYVGRTLAIDLYVDFHKHWKWTDSHYGTGAVNGFLKLVDFVTAASKLSDAIDKDIWLLSGCPFDDFEDTLIELINWQQVVLNKLGL